MIHGDRRRPYCRIFMDWAGWRKRRNVMVNKSIFRASPSAEMREVTHLITVLLVYVIVSEGWSTYCEQVIMQGMTGQLKFLACNKIGRIMQLQTNVDTKAQFTNAQSRVFRWGRGTASTCMFCHFQSFHCNHRSHKINRSRTPVRSLEVREFTSVPADIHMYVTARF